MKEPHHNAKATIGDLLRCVELIGVAFQDIQKRIAKLEAQPPGFDYTGTFEQGRAYKRGQGCTQGGSIFIAMKDYPGIPGTFNCGWKLAVKRGRDAK